MSDNFGNQLIRSLEAGRESKRRKMHDEWEEEDRGVEKQLLQHRLRELKIGESLKKREIGLQNLKLMEGMPEMDIPDNLWEPMDDPNGLATVPESIQQRRRFAPQEIPGVEEYGVKPMKYRPQTQEQSMERQLQQFITQKRAEEMYTPYNLPPDTQRVVGGKVVAQGAPRTVARAPQAPIRTTERDAAGVETDTFHDPQSVIGQSFTRQPAPVRSGAGGAGSRSANRLTDDEVATMAGALADGSGSISKVPGSTDGMRILSAAKKLGFNSVSALNDHKAMQAFYGAMNSEDMNKLRAVADQTDTALANLELLAQEWDGGGYPVLSAANLALVKRGSYGNTQLANDIEESIKQVTEGLAVVSRNGSAPTNAALESASKVLSSDWSKERLVAATKSLRKNLAIRNGSIRGLEPLMPGGGAAPGSRPPIPDGAAPGVATNGALTPAAVAEALKAQRRPFDPETVKKVMASPAALKALFPGQ